MKNITHIHEGTIHLVEPGDRLHFHAPDGFRDDWEGERDFDITVRETFLNSRHGPRIFSVEKIRARAEDDDYDWPEHMRTCDDWYLVDDWVITVSTAERDAARQKAAEAAKEAQDWLDSHPHFHSARRADVKALIAAVRSLS